MRVRGGNGAGEYFFGWRLRVVIGAVWTGGMAGAESKQTIARRAKPSPAILQGRAEARPTT